MPAVVSMCMCVFDIENGIPINKLYGMSKPNYDNVCECVFS